MLRTFTSSQIAPSSRSVALGCAHTAPAGLGGAVLVVLAEMGLDRAAHIPAPVVGYLNTGDLFTGAESGTGIVGQSKGCEKGDKKGWTVSTQWFSESRQAEISRTKTEQMAKQAGKQLETIEQNEKADTKGRNKRVLDLTGMRFTSMEVSA